MKKLLLGLVYASLWATAGVVNKIGLAHGQPLLLTNTRFLIASLLLLIGVHVVQRQPLPRRGDWFALLLYGFLNNTLCVALFIYAIKQTSAGIGTLALALNPLLISVLSAVWYQRPIGRMVWLALALGFLGVLTATYPLLQSAYVSVWGMVLMLASMLCYSVGTVYYAHHNWQLPKWVINTWQISFGALLLLPVSLLLNDWHAAAGNGWQYWAAVWWLAVPVTIVAVQIWLYMLSHDALQAAMWLFVCPIFGFFYAHLILHEPISAYTFAGTALVLLGLYLGQYVAKRTT